MSAISDLLVVTSYKYRCEVSRFISLSWQSKVQLRWIKRQVII